MTPGFLPDSISLGHPSGSRESAAVVPSPKRVPPAGLGLRRPPARPRRPGGGRTALRGPARARLAATRGPTRPAARRCPHGARRPPRETFRPGHRWSGGPTNSPQTPRRRAPPAESGDAEQRLWGPPSPPGGGSTRLLRPRPRRESLRPGPVCAVLRWAGPTDASPPPPTLGLLPAPLPAATQGQAGGKTTACSLGDLNKALCQYCARVWALPKLHPCKYS